MDQYGYPFVINVDLDYMLLQNIKKTKGIKMITRLGLLNISKRGNCNILKIVNFDTFNVFITFDETPSDKYYQILLDIYTSISDILCLL